MAKKELFLPEPSISRPAVKRNGSILVLALWSLCLLSTFAVILSYGVRQKATLVNRLDERSRLYLVIDACVRQSLVYLKNSVKSYDALNDPWTNGPVYKGMAIGDGRCDVGYDYTDPQSQEKAVFYGLMDEERKININKASQQVLEHFFAIVAGTDESTSKDLAASIIDWRDADYELSVAQGSAEDAYYKGLTAPYPAANSDFQVPDELLLIKGMDDELFSKVRDYITVYGSGLVNANTAEKAVLMSLGLDDYTAQNIILFRRGEDGIAGTADDGVFESSFDVPVKMSAFCSLNTTEQEQLNSVSQQNLTTKSDNFMIKCVASLIGRRNKAQATCVVNKAGKILYWHQI